MELTWWIALLCGLMGGFLVEVNDFIKAMRDNSYYFPEEYKRPGWILARSLRLLSGAILAWAFWASDEIDTVISAMALGVSAPLILERIGAYLPPPTRRSIENNHDPT